MSTQALGTTNQSAQIVGVGNAVGNGDDGVLAPLARDGKDVLNVNVFLLRRHSNNALVGGKSCDRVQLGAVNFDDGDLLFQRLRDQNDDRTLALAALNEQLIDGALTVEQLTNGVSADDDTAAQFFVDGSLPRLCLGTVIDVIVLAYAFVVARRATIVSLSVTVRATLSIGFCTAIVIFLVVFIVLFHHISLSFSHPQPSTHQSVIMRATTFHTRSTESRYSTSSGE